MRLSDRITGFQASPIRRLVPFANDAKKNNIHVYHLNIGQPDINTPPQVFDAIRSYNKPYIPYGQSEGDLELREALPAYYKQYGAQVSVDDIMITTGGSEALQFVFMAICDPEDQIIIPEPYYTNVGAFANAANVELVAVTSSLKDNFVLPTIEEFEKAITEKTRGILLCSPNNPTGHIYSEKELLQILELVKKYQLFLVVDEVYREFCYDDEEFSSILKYEEYSQQVIVVDSFSKRYNMCGSRIGTLVTKNRDVLHGVMKLAQARLCPPDIEQVAALAAVKTPKEYLEKVKLEYQSRRDFLVDQLKNIEGIKFSVPKGAFYLVVELPVEDAEDFCIFLLRDFNLDGKTVMLAPAEGFYVTPNLGRQEVRIAYVLNKEDLKVAVDCLKEALRVYPKKIS
jgi:aspartate aminotransferase